MKPTYSELLRDPRWQRKRLEVLSRSDFTCEVCGAADRTLNVHHKAYKKGAKPWEYEITELRALCEECHEAHHHLEAVLRAKVAEMGLHEIELLLGFIEAREAIDTLLADENPHSMEFSIRGLSHISGIAAALAPAASCYWDLRADFAAGKKKTLTGSEAFHLMNAEGLN